MKRYVAKPVMASNNTREADQLYRRIFNTFIKPTAELDEDGNYVFYNDYGRRVFDPTEAKRIINYALAGSMMDRPSDKEIIDEVLDNAVWNANDAEEY